MKTTDVLEYAGKSLRQRTLRSGLTVLGIVIGIAAIVVLVALAQGIDHEVRKQLDLFGSNYVTVIPGSMQDMQSSGGASFRGALYTRDVELLKRVPGVRGVSGYVLMLFAQLRHRGENVTATVYGVDPDVMNLFIKTGLEEGAFMRSGDTEGVFIGANVAHALFEKDVHAGETMYIQNSSFRVRGIMNKVGDYTGDFDDGIYIDEHAARDILGTAYDRNRVATIMIVTEEGADVAAQADAVLQKSHKVSASSKDYEVSTPQQLAAQVSTVTGLLSLVLGGVAAIALVVGGIGIANAMFTSVLERTREIGTLKALGASGGSIRRLFLVEAGLLGMLGGILGLALGGAVAWILGKFGVPALVTWELAGFAMVFALAVGLISGYVPARDASRLQPVEALRYE